MIEFYIDTRVDLKTVLPHGPLTICFDAPSAYAELRPLGFL